MEKVLLITDEMMPGGVAKHVTDLANELDRRGIGVTVAAADGPFRRRIKAHIPFISIPLIKIDDYRRTIPGFFKSYSTLQSLIRRDTFTLIHSHKRFSDLLGRILARQFSLPHVSTLHSAVEGFRRLSVFGDHTIACSRYGRELLINYFQKNEKDVSLIYNGINPLRKHSDIDTIQIRDGYGISQQKRIVAAVGRLDEPKDWITFLKAVRILKIRKDISDILFVILGEGTQKPNLLEKIKEFAIEENIIFLHQESNVEKLFTIAEFGVLSTKGEGGVPYVIIEAASVGKPSIATGVGGVTEFIMGNETGIVTAPHSAEQLSDAICFLLDNPPECRRLGEKAREKMEEHHSIESMGEKIIQVYQSCLHR